MDTWYFIVTALSRHFELRMLQMFYQIEQYILSSNSWKIITVGTVHDVSQCNLPSYGISVAAHIACEEQRNVVFNEWLRFQKLSQCESFMQKI